MKWSLLALLAAPAAMGQMMSSNGSAYLTQVLGALTAANLTSLVSVASAIANTTEGMALLGSLASGNKTVFAPSNAAFANVSKSVSSNTTLLTQILSYHILNNTYSANGTMTAPSHTIARSLLNGGGYMLPGNFSAPLVLAKANMSATSFQIVEAASNLTAMGPAVAANLNVYVIDKLIALPPTVASAVGQLLPALDSVLNSSGLLKPLAAVNGLTVFAPSNAAIQSVLQAVGMLNMTQLQTLLANHVINGSVAYSTDLASSNYTSAAGEPFTFMSNTSGTYVMSSNATAKIIQSDIILSTGVVHVIDAVLVNTMGNPTAAASAASSYAAVASTSTEANMPVTATSMAMGGGGAAGASGASGASSSASSTAKASAGSKLELGLGKALTGGILCLTGLLMGGGLLLL